jgi:hypothetical protein
VFSNRPNCPVLRSGVASSGSHQQTEASRPPPDLIAKPKGIYNARLQSLLNWESDRYGAIQVTDNLQCSISTVETAMTPQAFIHDRARVDLDISLPLKKQVPTKVKELQDAVCDCLNLSLQY